MRKTAQQIKVESSQLSITCSLIIHRGSNNGIKNNKKPKTQQSPSRAGLAAAAAAAACCHNYNCNIGKAEMNCGFDMCRHVSSPSNVPHMPHLLLQLEIMEYHAGQLPLQAQLGKINKNGNCGQSILGQSLQKKQMRAVATRLL